jgi:hypothetical protein
MEKQATCISGAQTLDGSRFSNSRTVNSSIGLTIRSLMFQTQKMLKDKKLESKTILEEAIKDGQLFILIKLKRIELRASTKSSVSISIDHSTSDQECQ